MSDNKIKTWLERIFFFPMCCDFLRAIGKWISEDKSLTEDDKAILRQHWENKFKACKKAKLITYDDADKMVGVEVSKILKKII